MAMFNSYVSLPEGKDIKKTAGVGKSKGWV